MFNVRSEPLAALCHPKIKTIRKKVMSVCEHLISIGDAATGRARLCIGRDCVIFYILWGPQGRGDGVVAYMPNDFQGGRIGAFFEYNDLYWVESLASALEFSYINKLSDDSVHMIQAAEAVFAVTKQSFADLLLSLDGITIAAICSDDHARVRKAKNGFDAAVAYINPPEKRPPDPEEALWRMFEVGDWRTRSWAPTTS